VTRRSTSDVPGLVEKARAGDARAVARLISLVEDASPLLREVMAGLATAAAARTDGGAIALGHPIGMSGARLALHLALELKRRGGGVGAAALCGGGGQGEALIIRVPA
jgi:acetyl-CoA acetyltransferase